MSFNLQSLIERVDWIKITSTSGHLAQDPNKIAISYSSPHKDGKVNRIKVKIGNLVLERMKWQQKDRICVYQNPDDLMDFMLIKSENEDTGYRLASEGGGRSLVITYPWKSTVILKPMKTTVVDHLIDPTGRFLVFRAK